MGRWQPDALGRLQQAALDLYREHGYEQVTVAQIAARAGVTERTFFRYFADKREVLFAGSDDLQRFLIEAVAAVPAEAPPIEAIARALETAAAELFQYRREYSAVRQAVLAANTALQERELMKLARLGRALAASLRARGVDEPEATLAAEAGVVALRLGFERWTSDSGESDLGAAMRATLEGLGAVASAGSVAAETR